MPVIFKPVGMTDLNGVEIHEDLPNTFKLADIENIFAKYGLTAEDFNTIKFIDKHTTIKKDEEKTYSNTVTILVFSVLKTTKDKLEIIFKQKGKKTDPDISTLIEEDQVVDPFIQKPLDKAEPKQDFILDDNFVKAMNMKTVELFNDEDFQHLIRIYSTKKHLYKTLNQYVSHGTIVKINIPKSEVIDLYEEEISQLRKVGITESDETIRQVLSNFNGHLNLSLRDLLCKKAVSQTPNINMDET